MSDKEMAVPIKCNGRGVDVKPYEVEEETSLSDVGLLCLKGNTSTRPAT